MVQTVELLLDEATEAAVVEQWQALVDDGLPSSGRNPSPTNRPHVTTAVATAMPSGLDDELATAVGALPLPTRLGGLVVFGGRRLVLSRLVVASAGLVDLHARVADVVAACPGQPANARPGAWTPHVTLARGLTPEQLGRAVAVLGRAPDLEAQVVAVRRWDGEARVARLLPPSPDRGSHDHGLNPP